MNTFRKKINTLSIPETILITGVLISVSIFFTVFLFFGGINNRNKIFSKNPVPVNNRNVVQNNQVQNSAIMTGSQNILKATTSTSNTIKKTGTSKTR